MTAEASPQPPPRRTGRQAGYEGKPGFDAADQRFRRAVSRLARDADSEARLEGARLVQEAADALHALAQRADEASSAHKRLKAEQERLSRRLDAQLERVSRRGR